MQPKKGHSNKKLLNAVQNLSSKKYIKTPQNKIHKKTRAKYDCPKALADLIYVANLLPTTLHFELIEAARAVIEKYERFKPPDIVIDETLSVDEVLERTGNFMARMKNWDGLIDLAYNHKANWLEFFLSLPDEIRDYLNRSDEIKEFRKSDSYEYWVNNDGEAWDLITDLHNGNEISDEEFKQLEYTGDVADFLVDKGYYGESWSHSRKEDDENYRKWTYNIWDDEVEFSSSRRGKDDFYFTEYFAQYRAYLRMEESRDFIIGLANLTEKLREKENQMRLDLFEILPKKLVDEVRATQININEQSEIHFSISKWAEAIQGVDISRIRRCDVCKKIFWANRKDAFACSPKHAKTRQMRLLRANWKEKGKLYLKERKKKAKKKKENKKNGSL